LLSYHSLSLGKRSIYFIRLLVVVFLSPIVSLVYRIHSGVLYFPS